LFLCGVDGARSFELRYSVYRKEGNALAAREFAFSIDNVRPLSGVPWFCLHEGEHETWALARLVRILRSDPEFRSDYGTRMDGLLEEKRMLVRQGDGYLGFLAEPLSVSEWEREYEKILLQLEREGFVDRAVSVLNRAGFRAWCNAAGHVAVDPAHLQAEVRR
jgi:hypothetical protein